MSQITSSAYPVVTVSKAGDQFAIVQNGQLKKLTRQGLADFIATLAPNTFIALTDGPGSYVGQAGKAVVVNSTEDGVEFQPATSGNFLALADTPGSYGGNAGRLAVVNPGETAMEFVDNAFIELGDTPASYAGALKYIARVNAAGTAIEFVTPTVAAPAANYTGGFFDYNHGGGTQAYTGGTGKLKLLNDETGTFTLKTYAPPGVTDVWNAATNQLDLSELSLGDEVEIRFTFDVTTTAINQSVETFVALAVGTGIEYELEAKYEEFKTAGTYPVRAGIRFYIGNTETRDNPGEFRFLSDNDATVSVDGWYISVRIRGAV